MSNKASHLEFLNVRGLRYAIRHWGKPEAPHVFFLHGWMDSSPTFQFLVDALQQEWHVIAPDWRGYGNTEWLCRPYWFPDYYGDLDALLQHYSPGQPARLVGHSMGANIAAVYASARPERVSQIAMLDFLGLAATEPKDAPQQLTRWLDHISAPPRLNSYADYAALQSRMQQVNPRLTAQKASYLARALSRAQENGRIQMACDPWHRVPSPMLYRIDDQLAAWNSITAPVLMLISENGFVHERFGNDKPEQQRRLAAFKNLTIETITDCGHNLQHDQPEQVATALEHFLRRNGSV